VPPWWVSVSELGGIDSGVTPALLAQVEAIARAAGAVILQVYGTDFAVADKADASPVTAADEQAEALITPALQALQPAWAVVAEEAAAQGQLPQTGRRWWLVDPLDGTREFVSRNGEFTVNIALIEDGMPVLGVVFVPVQDLLYAGLVGQGAWLQAQGLRREIRCRAAPPAGITLACSRSHGDEAATAAWLNGRPVAATLKAGSSLKFGLIAAGLADVYPRLGRTMEWDTAAGHAVLRAAGGTVCDLAGRPLRYGKPGYENPHFVAAGP
jgi:3'(2'), 5'-bisphosphate nucleotidase